MRTLIAVTTLAVALALAAPANAAVTRLGAQMSGAQEAPTAGDPDGTGTARVRVNAARRRVCFTIRTQGIDASVAAHIHRGRRGEAGSIVVPLFEGRSTAARRSGCTEDLDRALLREIARHPGRFYANVHTEAFPGGAVRGQLRRAR